ncbi:ATP-binding protein [Mycolicibacterium sp. Y3]
MRRMWFLTARPRPPFEWSVLGTRIGSSTGAFGLSGFAGLFVLTNFGQTLAGWVLVAVTVSLALAAARWLTAMKPPKPGIALREGTQLGLLRRRLSNPEWSNNRKWPSPIAARHGNVVILKNGDAWVNYLVEGINFSPHDLDSVEGAQFANAGVFANLAALGFVEEVYVRGFKVKVPAETLTRRCIDHVPSWARYESTWYRAASEGLTHFNNMYKTGERASFERPFWISLKVGSVDPKFYERWLESLGFGTALVDTQVVQVRERQVWDAIPAEFNAVRTNPGDLEWAIQRASTLGLSNSTVPYLPGRKQDPTMVPGNNNFPLVTITSGHEAESLADTFLDRCAAESNGNADRLARIFRDGVLHRYRSLRRESSIAVHVPGRRTTDLPDGYTTYQTVLTVASGPSLQGSYAIQKMSGIVDGFHGLDGDIAMRITFTPLPGRKAAKVLGKAQRRNNADDEALSESEFDATEFAEKDSQLRTLFRFASGEGVLANVHLSFIFGDANYHKLEEKVQKVIGELASTKDDSDDSFQVFRHVGAQQELWQSLLPCTAATPLIDDTRLTQTPALLGAVMPLRRQTLGDPYGWPIGVNQENSLGQVVYSDFINPTAAGDGSIMLFGEQGTGKSMFMKTIAFAVHDLLGEVWLVDPTGEMEVVAGQLDDAVVLDLIDTAVSLDLLKCLPPGEAAAAWLDTWCPLLGVELNTEEYERLATVIAPAYREVHYSPLSNTPGLNTTRQVFEHIAHESDEVAVRLRRALNGIKALPGVACLLDPVDVNTGKVHDLPAFNAAQSRFVVFNTRQYVLRAGETETATSSRIATAVFTTIAALAKFYFDRSPRVCLFGLDEAHSLDAPIIKRNILADTNKKGRKFKNLVLVSTQTAQDVGDGLELVTKRGSFRQRSAENAVPALRKVHITPTPSALNLISRHLSPIEYVTSDPRDPIKVIKGREGELLWFDGTRVGKMQTFPPFIPSRAAAADTSPDKIVRVDDHRAALAEGRHRVG